jgi:hypothetical protein
MSKKQTKAEPLQEDQHIRNGRPPGKKSRAARPPAKKGATPAEGASNGQVIDPFDPANFKKPQSLKKAAAPRPVLLEVPVLTSPKAEWIFTIRDDPAYMLETNLLVLKDAKEQYLVASHLHAALEGEPCLQAKTLYTCVTSKGKVFLWAVWRLRDGETRAVPRWMEPSHLAVEMALKGWIRFYWNQQTASQEADDSPYRGTPKWPDKSFRDLLALGFGKYAINGLDHAALVELRGEGV